MKTLFGTTKWMLIVLVILAWMVLCLVNLHGASPLILVPGHLVYQQVPMSLILFLPLLVAFVVFWLVGMLDQVDHFLKEREYRKRIRDLEREVDQLRNLPIRDGLVAQQTVDKENKT